MSFHVASAVDEHAYLEGEKTSTSPMVIICAGTGNLMKSRVDALAAAIETMKIDEIARAKSPL